VARNHDFFALFDEIQQLAKRPTQDRANEAPPQTDEVYQLARVV
jgi:hypothetical protein